ncbi:hypothetical protein [Lacticaseibacillus rhamnosus]|uniref:hypothetical protein n=1 Tax=Lacticaseibacillus rhamnosus TaxID=47715 RepID=UPI00062A3D3D|nr:hypothetical protein [Lacticaseibacillus rhamnosus]KKW88331.1 hypothetical protein XA20_04665 [Lacticaseibacillus rhamnosus]MCZ2733617.1 hypothetical protein [Lacticaseibacillus rhamnosus]MCZ2736300.1 hypothetical protein [Lacticaseibacillus rhamnosus]MCZ2742626.1 hypothetical protein [Lacticaseibacillus rhamnosus]MCZ2745370.1 hypothetical protein [Lacticaseibacillus rhamnosus]
MRDTKGYWQDKYFQMKNLSLKGNLDSVWEWMLRLSKIMLNKSKQKNPTVAPAGFQEQNKLNFKLSVSRKAAK